MVEADAEMAVFVGDDTYQVSLRRVARRFYTEHDDIFDTLVVFPAFATPDSDGGVYEAVSNDVVGVNMDQGGLNPETFDFSVGDEYSSERLEGIIQIGDLRRLPDDPAAPVLGPLSTLDVLAQEVGHRYGAFLWFAASDGPSDQLLRTDLGHWSFFLDTGGSPLGGNGWMEAGGGASKTVAPSGRYAPLDLYLLGLLPADEVEDIRVLDDPNVTTKSLDIVGRPYSRDSIPAPGVVVQGQWQEVSIEQIVAVENPRRPSSSDEDPVRRQAFIALQRAGDGGIDDATMARLEALRQAWVLRYAEITEGRGRVIASLDGADELPRFPRALERHGWRREGGAFIHDRLRFAAQPSDVAAVRGEGACLVRFQTAGGAWSAGVAVDLPGLAAIADDPAYKGVITGLRVDPVEGEDPPKAEAFDVGPEEEVGAGLKRGGAGPSCACMQGGAPSLVWAAIGRRG